MKKKNKTALRVISTATFLTMVASCAAPAFADAYGIALYGNYYLDQGSVSVRYEDGKYFVQQGDGDEKEDTDGPVTISNNEAGDTTNATNNTVTITTDTSGTANVTLDNVNIDASDTGKAAVSTKGLVSIELNGNNTLKGDAGHAALEKWSTANNDVSDPNYKLTITDDKNDNGTAKTGTKADTTGSLTATGGAGGAGIGGGIEAVAGGYTNNITITGGTITATGGDGAAGIGGGKGNSQNIAQKKYGGNAGDITIEGSNTTVIANGTGGGAGIGGGLGDDADQTGQGMRITIKDGAHVTATGGVGGAGIGGGDGSVGGNSAGMGQNITISGEGTTVIANSGLSGAGIGGGKNGQGGRISISDGADVTATGGSEGGAGIGSGVSTTPENPSRAANIAISGGTVNATGGIGGGAGIGGGKGDAVSIRSGGGGVTISGGKVTANGGNGAAGIGSGKDSGWALGSFVTITGGTVKATGGAGNAAGIGSGENDTGTATVTINTSGAAGSTLDVTAIAKNNGEAISGESGITMASLGNNYSGIVRFFHNHSLYNTVHNGQYVGMEDNNSDEHLVTDAHIWGDTEIIKEATPDEQGILRHHCAVDGCKGYYDEPYDYVAPDEPDNNDPTTPDVKPDVPGNTDTPAAPDTPVNPPVQDATPNTADTTPADSAVLPGNVQNPDVLDAKPEDAPVTPANAVNPPVQNAKALPQTGSNWLAVLGTALSGIAMTAVGFFLDRKRGENR